MKLSFQTMTRKITRNPGAGSADNPVMDPAGFDTGAVISNHDQVNNLEHWSRQC
jgi:hypothetical protein